MLRGWYSTFTKDYHAALRAMEGSQARFKSYGDTYWAFVIPILISFVHYMEGDLARARQEFEQFLPIIREMGDRRGVVNLLLWLGDIERASGRYNQAKRYYLELLEIAREIGEKSKIAYATFDLGLVALHENDLNEARLFLVESLALMHEVGMWDIKWVIFRFAILAVVQKNLRRAIQLFAFTDYLFRGGVASQVDEIERKRYLTLAREQVDEDTFNASWAEGCALTMEQAIAEAEQESLTPSAMPAPALPRDLHSLTPREIEVLRLVAAGLTDAQVATQLVISRRTVSTHLTAIYGKLGVTSRSAATRYALDHNLI
jgi:DNA-binding CsgD family transcriptional regulator/tetratricopeptide (TPR) repeat protein